MNALSYDVLLRIVYKLEMHNILKLSLALSSHGNILFMNDDFLFRTLCIRDFDCVCRREDFDSDASWKNLYKIMTEFRHQLHDEARVVMQIPPRYPRHVEHSWHVPLKVFNYDEEGYDLTDDAPCINDEGQDDEECVYSNLDDDEFMHIADLHHMKFLRMRDLEHCRIKKICQTDDYDYTYEYRPTDGSPVIVVKEGLCVWMEYEEQFERCQFILICPMEKIKELVREAEAVAKCNLAELTEKTDMILKQKVVMRYQLKHPELLACNTNSIWEVIKEKAKASDLEIENVQISPDATELFFVFKRLEPQWASYRFCMESLCHRPVLDRSRIDCDPSDSQAVRRKAYCKKHHISGYDITLEVLNNYRQRKFKIEYRNYSQRRFNYFGYCNMLATLYVPDVRNQDGSQFTGQFLLNRTYLATRTVKDDGSYEESELPLRSIEPMLAWPHIH